VSVKPKRLGRPPLADKAATGLVKVRLTESDRKRWQSAAEREGLSLSEWLRAAAELAVARGAR
jgi:predicted HicB family RNase H-like nuclease